MQQWSIMQKNSPFKLSVLDQSPICSGRTPADAIEETVRLAEATEQLGYHRYWLAEHHNSAGLACTSPEVLISRIASVTSSMRVGSGGVMLSHYSPLKVAETFRVLHTLFPGRIDLGVGRATGTDQKTTMALRYNAGGRGAEQFPHQVNELLEFLQEPPKQDGQALTDIHAMPIGTDAPPVWLLGSSDQSAALAAHFGCAFSFAHFINNQGGSAVMRAYRENFQPRDSLPEPAGSIGVFAICAETEAEAKRLCTSRDLWRLKLDYGRMEPFSTIEEAEAYPYTDADRDRIAINQQRQAVGTPEQVKSQLMDLCEDYGVTELVILTICHAYETRLRSYELLSHAFELS